jgi:hypothetical protein
MPKHILERIAGPNVVRVQEYVDPRDARRS